MAIAFAAAALGFVSMKSSTSPPSPPPTPSTPAMMVKHAKVGFCDGGVNLGITEDVATPEECWARCEEQSKLSVGTPKTKISDGEWKLDSIEWIEGSWEPCWCHSECVCMKGTINDPADTYTLGDRELPGKCCDQGYDAKMEFCAKVEGTEYVVFAGTCKATPLEDGPFDYEAIVGQNCISFNYHTNIETRACLKRETSSGFTHNATQMFFDVYVPGSPSHSVPPGGSYWVKYLCDIRNKSIQTVYYWTEEACEKDQSPDAADLWCDDRRSCYFLTPFVFNDNSNWC